MAGAEMSYFAEQYEALQVTIPDVPRNEPVYKVNAPLWRFWQTVQPSPESPMFTEQEIVRRLDLLYAADGTCSCDG